MKAEEFKCDCCKIRKAVVKDYRDGEQGGKDKYFVCGNCFNLTDRDFFLLL